ncbi:MAG: hypothetical protein FWH07_02945 [Oscillospiraceae bacterium]|nr:hypothetical protein [Oscillospiraceae bacterium]
MSNETRFADFVRELTELSIKHKIAIKSIGGVHIYDCDISDIVYSNDSTSGDLYYEFSS